MNDALSRVRSVLDTPADGTAAGVAIAAIAIVVCIWGALAVADAYREHGRPDLPRRHPRRWVAPCYGFFLGWFLLLADGVIYAAIAFDVLSRPERLELGWAVYLVGCGVLAMMAFGYWARERLPQRSER